MASRCRASTSQRIDRPTPPPTLVHPQTPSAIALNTRRLAYVIGNRVTDVIITTGHQHLLGTSPTGRQIGGLAVTKHYATWFFDDVIRVARLPP